MAKPLESSNANLADKVEGAGGFPSLLRDGFSCEPGEHAAVSPIQHLRDDRIEIPRFTPIGQNRTHCGLVQPDLDAERQVRRVQDMA